MTSYMKPRLILAQSLVLGLTLACIAGSGQGNAQQSGEQPVDLTYLNGYSNHFISVADLDKFRPGRPKNELLQDLQGRAGMVEAAVCEGKRVMEIVYVLLADPKDPGRQKCYLAMFVEGKFEKFVRTNPDWPSGAKPTYFGECSPWLARDVKSPPLSNDDLRKEAKSFTAPPGGGDGGLQRALPPSAKPDHAPTPDELKRNAAMREQFRAVRLDIGMTEQEVEAVLKAKPIDSGELKAGICKEYGGTETFPIPNHFHNVMVVYRDGKVIALQDVGAGGSRRSQAPKGWVEYFRQKDARAVFSGEKNASPAEEKPPADMRLEVAWSLEGTWTGVVSDESKGAIYALARDGKCVELDLAGKQQREFEIPDGNGSVLRLASLRPGKEKALLAFSIWGEELRAFDLNGKKLWNYRGGAAIDDAWVSDLNGDGLDEVIIGHNGDGGVHVLYGTGKLLWKSTAIGNVWHVCAGDVLGVGKPQVVTTSAAGKVHIFDRDGRQVKDLDAHSYAEMVRISRSSKKDEGAMILVAGSSPVIGRDQPSQILSGMNGRGDIKWSVELPSGSVHSAFLAQTKPWLAVGMRGGQVVVVDVENGRIIAGSEDQGKRPAVAWASGKDSGSPLLLVATGGKLNAYRVAKSR